MLLYVGRVLRFANNTNGLTNKGFLVYGFDEEDICFGGKVPVDIPGQLKNLCCHLLQVGPRKLVEELFQLIREIVRLKESHPQPVEEFIKLHSTTKKNSLIQFTDKAVLKEIGFTIPASKENELRTSYVEFLRTLAHGIINELNGTSSGDYNQIAKKIG